MLSLQEISDDKKRFFLLSSIVMLVLLSWSGILDRLSYEYLDDSFTLATASYVTARLINAGVSAVQTTEVSVGVATVASMQIGQLLDPINDMVERFSDLMVMAIGSIISQKILLGIVSSIFFKSLLTVSGLLLIVSIYIKEAPFIKVLSKTFIFLVFLRLALSLMVLLNYSVDEAFLDGGIKHNQAQIQILSDDLGGIKNEQTNRESKNIILESDIQDLIHKKDNLSNKHDFQKEQLKKLQGNLKNTAESISKIESKLSMYEKYNPLDDNGLKGLQKRLSEEQSLVTEEEAEIEKTIDIIEDINSQITYKRNIIEGKSNGVIDSIGNGLSSMAESIKSIDVSKMYDKLDNIIGSLVDLLILYTMKTLILPLLFLYLFLKAFRLIWGINFVEFVKREYKTLKPEDKSPVSIDNK